MEVCVNSTGSSFQPEEIIDEMKMNSVTYETKTLLTQINRYIQKFIKLYQNKHLKNEMMEVIKKNSNEEYIRSLNKFQSIVEMRDLRNRRKDYDEIFNNLDQVLKKKEESELYKIRKKEFDQISEKINIKINELDFTSNKMIESELKPTNSNGKTTLNLSENNNEKMQYSGLNKVFLKCYICKESLIDVHFFYPSMCVNCGNSNYKIRQMNFDLSNRIAIVTGARVKIGYQTGLRLLRANCRVIATSRFPKDTLSRYRKEPDFENFKSNLNIYPLDLRSFPSIDRFIHWVESNFSHIDILINNAAQTLRRSADYYKYLLEVESQPITEDLQKIIANDNENKIFLNDKDSVDDVLTFPSLEKYSLPQSVIMSQKDYINENKSVSDPSILGYDLQPIDFNSKSSWRKQIDEINFLEFAEVQLINSWAPYYLCKNLKEIMLRSPFTDKYIINVAAAEGAFYKDKLSYHPHTNMAKASLNMLTSTCSGYFKKFGIYINSVDTGWISCMQEWGAMFSDSTSFNKHDLENIYTNLPLDDLDGAMRIIHPILEGTLFNNYISGSLFKNYKIHDW